MGEATACPVCGDRGLADVILNIALFIPLGVSIALRGGSLRHAFLWGALLSIAVETAQRFFIPGRYASLGDLFFNTFGAGAGLLLLRTLPHWLRPNSTLAARLSLGAGLFTSAAIAATGWLFAPAPSSGDYVVSWQPKMRNLEQYKGVIRSVTVGGQSLVPPRHRSPDLADLIRDQAPIQVRLTAGPPVRRLSAFVTVHDLQGRQILAVGPDAQWLVVRFRTRSSRLRLDQPDMRAPDIFRDVRQGQELLVTARKNGRDFCLGLSADPPCGFGLTAGSGWGLLFFQEQWPKQLYAGLNAFWIAALAFPVGLWLRPRWESVLAGCAVIVALTFMPVLVDLRSTPPLEYGAALAGIVIGIAVALAGRRSALNCQVQ
ncbi:MAG: VanZ family protein [Longimicrobiales bacterium]